MPGKERKWVADDELRKRLIGLCKRLEKKMPEHEDWDYDGRDYRVKSMYFMEYGGSSRTFHVVNKKTGERYYLVHHYPKWIDMSHGWSVYLDSAEA